MQLEKEKRDAQWWSAEVEGMRKEEEETERLIKLAFSKASAIFKDIQVHSPEIKQSPHSLITEVGYDSNGICPNIKLKWGNKFEMTTSEKEYIEKYRYRRKGISALFTDEPDKNEICEYDYFELEFWMSPKNTSFGFRVTKY